MKSLVLLLSLLAIVPSCSFFHGNGRQQKQAKPIALEPQVYISYLDPEMNEGSGLIMFHGKLWTVNDSGGLPILYGFDRHTGNVMQRVRVRNYENIDWEALSQDGKYLYVGDIGNNSGVRKNLRIIRIEKSDIPQTGDVEVDGESISFLYNDQVDYSFRIYKHSHDCEAMIALHDSLWLFSKDWIKQVTKLYVVPSVPGHYLLSPVDSFNVNGLITDASLYESPARLVLSGYKDYSPFLWIFSDFKGTHFFDGKSQRIDMPKIFGVQTEGVFMKNPDSIFISSEKAELPPQLYLLKL